MSERGMRVFRDYIDNNLDQGGSLLRAEEHAEILIAEANAAGIPIPEITEEVGDIADAIAVVQLNKERHAYRT